MTTYNGARFVDEQLASIFAQSVVPDEIVICDDQSTDDTVAKLRAYEQQYPAVVRVVQNDRNLGYVHNFEKAVSLCTGDIIFFCDQDDVWFPHKVARMLEVFAADAACAFVFSDAEVTDERLVSKGYNVYDRYIRPDLRPGKTLTSFIHKINLLGCTSAFRASYLPHLLPINTNIWGHDHWIAFILTIIAQIRMVDEPLMYYRRHTSNAGNKVAWNGDLIAKLRQKYDGMFAANYQLDIQVWYDMLQHLLTLRGVHSPLFAQEQLEAGIAAVQTRLAFAQNRLALKQSSRFTRLPLAWRLLRSGDYKRYVRGARTFVKDLVA